ncbi:MAG: hypothetical protein AMS22_02945 [Thiotrichales bacterium SG8_50]|nr:MAG: hypothetical protein AMS22_02945 [Thiotrichales bacterium SG8_50]
MTCHNPRCLGNYDFDQVVFFARKRFVEGCDTVALLQQAKSDREREEIALVAMLDLDDERVRDLRLTCRYDDQCSVTTCRDTLRELIEQELSVRER